MSTTVRIGREFLRSGFLRHFGAQSSRPSFNDAYLWIQVYVNSADRPLPRPGIIGMKRPTKKKSIERLLRSGWISEADGGLVVPEDKRALAMAGKPTWLWFMPMRFGWLSVPARVTLMLIDESVHGCKFPRAVSTLARRAGISKKTMKKIRRELLADHQLIAHRAGGGGLQDTHRGVPGWLDTQKLREGYLRGPSRSVPFVLPLRSVCSPPVFTLDPQGVPFVPPSGSLDHSVGSLWNPSEADRSVSVKGSPENKPTPLLVPTPPEEESRLSLLCRVILNTDPVKGDPSALQPDAVRNCCAAKRSLYQDLPPGGFLAFLMGVTKRKVPPFMTFYSAGGLEAVAKETQEALDGLFRLDDRGDMDIQGIDEFFEAGTAFVEQHEVSMTCRREIAGDLEARTETNGWPESRAMFRLTADQDDQYVRAYDPKWDDGAFALSVYLREHHPDPEGPMSWQGHNVITLWMTWEEDTGDREWAFVAEALDEDHGDGELVEDAESN